jgi:hypothetical protein
LCGGANGGNLGVFPDFVTGQVATCVIDDCGTTITPPIRAQGWCVYSCQVEGGGKKYAVFFIKTVCGFVGPYYVF